MNLNHLEYFLEAINCKSITKASEKLYLSPATLVTAIKSLEKELGYQLLIRSHSGVTPTAAGIQIYNDILKIKKITQSWYSLDKINNLINSVSIKVVPSIYESIGSHLSIELLEAYPNIFLDITPLYSRNFEKEFYENTIKIAIGSYHELDKISIEAFARNSNLKLDILFEDYYIIYYGAKNEYFSGKNAVNLDEYKLMERVIFHSQKTFECEMNEFYNKFLPLCTFEQLLEYISTHNCVTVLPSILQNHNFFSNGKVCTCPFQDCHKKIWFYMLSHPENQLSFAERSVRDYIKVYFHSRFS